MNHRSLEKSPPSAPLSFADEADVDRFVEMLERFERGEIGEAEWRAFRVLCGTYGQRQEGDWSMVRAKLPQGIVNGAQLHVLADVADRYSRGFCHVTTRQNVQLHFMHLPEVEDALRAFARVGITTREACGNSVRNVTAGPTAGVAADEAFDVVPYAEAMTRWFLRHPLASTLPRKFKIAFSGGGRDHAFAAVNDIGWHARVDAEGRRGFLVTVAGGTATLVRSGHVLAEHVPAGEILALAEAVLRVFHRLGDRVHRHKARMKYVVRELGWERFQEEVRTELENVRREGAPELPFDSEAPDREEAPPSARRPRPTLAELEALAATATTGPGLHPRSLLVAEEASRWKRTNTAPQKQRDYAIVTITLPLGDVTSGQLRALAAIAAAFADGLVRLTPSQNLLLRWVPEHDLDALHASLRAIGLARPDAYSLADVVSCPGAESCKLAVTQSRGVARLVSDHFEGRALPELTVHVSGCPNGCGLHHVAAIGLQGGLRKVGARAVPQYFVYAGGGIDGPVATFGKVVAKIPARRVPQALERLVALAAEEGRPGEPALATLRRLDAKLVKTRLADLEALGEADATAEDFVDLGETEPMAAE